jgi:hypothetical protein
VQQSLLVLTRPQVGLGDAESLLAAARQEPLPAGPTAWPVVEPAPGEDGGEGDGGGRWGGSPGGEADPEVKA